MNIEMSFLENSIKEYDYPVIKIDGVLSSNFNLNWSPKTRNLDRKATQFCSRGSSCTHRNCFFGHSLDDMQENIKASIQEKTKIGNFLRGNPINWDDKYLNVIQKIVHYDCRNSNCRFNSLNCHYGMHKDSFVPKFMDGLVRGVELYNRIVGQIKNQLQIVKEQKQILVQRYQQLIRVKEMNDPMIYPPLVEREIVSPIIIIGFRNAIDRGIIFYETQMEQKSKFQLVLMEMNSKIKVYKNSPSTREKTQKPIKISEKKAILIQKLIRGYIVRRPLKFTKETNKDGFIEKIPRGGIYALLKYQRNQDRYSKRLLEQQEKKMKSKKTEMIKILKMISEEGIRVPSVLSSETPAPKIERKKKIIEKEVEEDEMNLGEIDIFEGQDEELEKSQWKLRVTFEQKGKKKWNTIVELSDCVKTKQYTIRLKQEFRSPVKAIESNYSTWIIPGDQRSFPWRDRLMEIFDIDKDQIKASVISFD